MSIPMDFASRGHLCPAEVLDEAAPEFHQRKLCCCLDLIYVVIILHSMWFLSVRAQKSPRPLPVMELQDVSGLEGRGPAIQRLLERWLTDPSGFVKLELMVAFALVFL